MRVGENGADWTVGALGRVNFVRISKFFYSFFFRK